MGWIHQPRNQQNMVMQNKMMLQSPCPTHCLSIPGSRQQRNTTCSAWMRVQALSGLAPPQLTGLAQPDWVAVLSFSIVRLPSGLRPHIDSLTVQLFFPFCRLFAPLLARLLTLSSPNTAAVARSTVGVTRMNAGSADNVLPDTGSVMFNFRLLPGAVLCCAVLCCAVLCCAVLGCIAFWSIQRKVQSHGFASWEQSRFMLPRPPEGAPCTYTQLRVCIHPLQKLMLQG